MQTENRRTPKEIALHDFTYGGPELTVIEAKDVLSKYSDGSGSVNLEKDVNNGLAKICLNNPRLKNAITGKVVNRNDTV